MMIGLLDHFPGMKWALVLGEHSDPVFGEGISVDTLKQQTARYSPDEFGLMATLGEERAQQIRESCRRRAQKNPYK